MSCGPVSRAVQKGQSRRAGKLVERSWGRWALGAIQRVGSSPGTLEAWKCTVVMPTRGPAEGFPGTQVRAWKDVHCSVTRTGATAPFQLAAQGQRFLCFHAFYPDKEAPLPMQTWLLTTFLRAEASCAHTHV